MASLGEVYGTCRKTIGTYPGTPMVVTHQRMYTANAVAMVMLGTDILKMCLHGL